MVYQVSKENSLEENYNVLHELLEVIKKQYKMGNNFSKNGDRFTNAEKAFMCRLENLCDGYKNTKDKKYLKMTSNILNKYNKIVDKYQ